ncbi:DUF6114 domain-containing protein [Streptomyces sp. 3214.6]|uniref:DUF6114 domain-containing protein n=1 Tax=Streptomyces sp. 3214.6 TaxID=1882757 RepID=UPI00090BE442|nr:DUF6114 domain-containing protein [Streptomyces sp. 3214.6]SHH94588.1 hypothetical protein SAMN05444521_2759 [Streptomyces sp. 3214.6]
MSAETPADPGQFTRRRQQFRAWRGTRPFWAGLFVLLAGFPIAYFPYAHLQVGHLTLAMSTTAGAGSLIIGVLLGVLGISLWFQKHVQVFAGVAAILLGLVSIPVSNLGGFLIGFLFALIGGAMAVSWAPGAPPAPAQSPEAVANAGDAPEGAFPESSVPAGDLTVNPYSTGPAPTAGPSFTKDDEATGEPHDLHELSRTSPANGANGRHSAG